jgi:hypothetical protein
MMYASSTTEGTEHETRHRATTLSFATNNSVNKEQTALTDTYGLGVAGSASRLSDPDIQRAQICAR